MRGGVGGLGIVGQSTRVHNLSSIRNHKQATHGHENIIYVCVWEALPHSHMYYVYAARGVSVELERVHKTTAQWKKNCNFLLAFLASFFYSLSVCWRMSTLWYECRIQAHHESYRKKWQISGIVHVDLWIFHSFIQISAAAGCYNARWIDFLIEDHDFVFVFITHQHCEWFPGFQYSFNEELAR